MISHVLPTYNRAPIAFERGEGSWAIATDGTRYLDLGAGIAVNALGHANPDLVATLTEQANRIWHVSNLYQIPEQEKLADLLVEHTFADTAFITNSGTEAAELAIKMVRKYWHEQGDPDRYEILTFEGAFHGRSTGAIAAAGSEKMVKGFGPLMPGFRQLPWGDMEALKAAISDRTAAVMLEPVQGEGGIRPLPDADLRLIRQLCDQTGALLVLDEVQSGMGRTGKLFAHEYAGITPDIMMIAKGIGGGFPLGAVLATEKAAAGMAAGTHGSTYGGNPLACAVGARVMQIVAAPEFLAEVNRKAALFRQKLEGLVAAHPDVFDFVRGQGLMLGLKCKVAPGDLVKAGYGEHILTVAAADDTLRLLPPLTISDEEIAEAVVRLDRAAGRIDG
ncbi:aspartate aminotransferase family protein [Paracoccus sp. P2]|uniref:Acetylornithine aminotransferase n=1 Tax=Paracoccus pantotrophus TaxID=82367 RepID=A0A1I5L532_PARPN|nr:aspartate aminotransferase family protein [Paracoccus pantotrophus]MDF3855992.1 aspartate aminotransferase family protein [Paracoccus pantotrophus]QFG37856.1 aspartate aminotransferase family protein [Paracoccus pantotrophus]QLH15406.1 aspartate aminotransferase family protein [Paracoccus pantotrophus]RDD93692.1 aspartate aminotransferase family protein [Paracoccus pantotrophus]RKS51674.1 acetylornithine aminotransferase [Paracoccus pantotrophus]